jgi:hypothetical protein
MPRNNANKKGKRPVVNISNRQDSGLGLVCKKSGNGNPWPPETKFRTETPKIRK